MLKLPRRRAATAPTPDAAPPGDPRLSTPGLSAPGLAQAGASHPPGRRGWHALYAVWALLLLGLSGGAGVLAWLGPLPPSEPPMAVTQPAPAAPATAEADEAPTRQATPERPIPPGIEPALLEAGPYGPLPRIGAAGRSSIRAYGRPFDRADPRPRIGLIVGGLGINAAVAEEALRRLPPGVTLAFSPYLPPSAIRLTDATRARGHELLLALPLEPTSYPLNNPGDRALLTGITPAENSDRLEWALSRFAGFVGAIGALGPLRGERFAALPERLNALQDALGGRGLLYVDPRPGARGPERAWGRAIDLVLDEPATRGEIALKLEALERLARERGSALGYAGEASPVLVDRVAVWAGGVENRGFALAPVSAMIRRPEAQASEAPRVRAN